MKQFRPYKLLPILLIFLISTSCVPEYQLARDFIDNKPEADILIIPPDYLFKTNLNIAVLGKDSLMDEKEKEAVLYDKSIFLKNISDSIFIEQYINSAILEFEKLGFRTYLFNFPDEILYDTIFNAFIFNIAQIEIEENVETYRDNEEFSGYTYYKDLNLKNIGIHSWIELSRANHKELTTLYDYQSISDLSYGYFNQNVFSGEVTYFENIVDMELDDIYYLATKLGTLHAQYLFDMFLNNHIRRIFPEKQELRHYLHYNPDENNLRSVEEEGFTILNRK